MKKSSELIKALFRDKRLENGELYLSLFGTWREIAGPDLADHCDLVDIRNNSAVILVDHPGWMQLLQIEKNRILKTMKKRYPALTIHSIQMHLVSPEELTGHKGEQVDRRIEQNSGQNSGQTDRPENVPNEKKTGEDSDTPSQDDKPQGDLDAIADPDLRNALRRLGKAIQNKALEDASENDLEQKQKKQKKP